MVPTEDEAYWLAVEKKYPWLKLYGWTYKQRATFVYGPNNRFQIQINPEFRDQLLRSNQSNNGRSSTAYDDSGYAKD